MELHVVVVQHLLLALRAEMDVAQLVVIMQRVHVRAVQDSVLIHVKEVVTDNVTGDVSLVVEEVVIMLVIVVRLFVVMEQKVVAMVVGHNVGIIVPRNVHMDVIINQKILEKWFR